MFVTRLFGKGLQEVTRGYRGLQEVTGCYKGLQGVTRGYKGLQGTTGDYKGLQFVRVNGYSLCRLMVRALLLMFLSLVYRRDPFFARCYIQCTHPLLTR